MLMSSSNEGETNIVVHEVVQIGLDMGTTSKIEVFSDKTVLHCGLCTLRVSHAKG